MSDRPSVPVWTWRDAIRKAKVPALTKHVCNMIANYVSDVGEGAFPSVRTLMEDTGMSNRSVATHLANAEAAGLLSIERTEAGADGRFKRSTYYPRFPDDAVLKRHATRISTPGNSEPDPEPEPGDNSPEDEDHVKEAHAVRPSEGASRGLKGDRVNLVHEPREPGAENRVKEVHANSPVELPKELPTHTPPLETEGWGRVRVQHGLLMQEIWEEVPEQRHIVELFIAPLWSAKQRPRGIHSQKAFLRDLRDGLARKAYLPVVLERAGSLASERRTVVPGLPESIALCEEAKRAVEAERQAVDRKRLAAVRAQDQPEVAARTVSLHERLRNRLGREVFESWFDDLECERIDKGQLIVSVPMRFKKSWIEGHYREELAQIAAAEFPGVGKVEIVAREARAA